MQGIRWLGLALLASCATTLPTGSPTERSEISPSTAASAAVVIPPAENSHDLLPEQSERILGAVSRLRELKPRGVLRQRSIDRQTMVRQLQSRAQKEVPAEALRGQGHLLATLGLIPDGFDFEAGLYSILESQLDGYYDPELKTMFLMDDLSPQKAEETLSHELVHALQDHNYNLEERLRYRPDSNDAQSATQSLAEGDAMSAMLDYVLEKQGVNALSLSDEIIDLQIVAGMALSPSLARHPSVLRNSLVAPYSDGLRLVNALRRKGGWAAVDELWLNPPTTTEQILHLDKLHVRESAEMIPVPAADALGVGWEPLFSDTFGEQGLRIAFEEWMPRRVAAGAAEAWAGDHAMVAIKHTAGGTSLAAAWRVRFDPAQAPASRDAYARRAFHAIATAWRLSEVGISLCGVAPVGTVRAATIHDRDVALVFMPTKHSASSKGCETAKHWANAIAVQH